MKMEVGGICGTDVKLYKHPPSSAPAIMGHENIGYIAKAGREFTRRKGFKEGDLVFVEHYVCAANASGAMPASTGIARIPIGAPIRTRSATATPRPKRRRICGAVSRNSVSAVECGDPSCTEGRVRGACRPGHADGERRRVVAVRRQCRLQFDGADPGTGPARPVADRDLQTGRRFADHRHRHLERQGAHGRRQEARRRLRDRREKEDPLPRIMEITGGKGVDVALDCTAGAGTIPILLGIEALKRKGGMIVAQGEMAQFPNFPLEKFTVKFITMKSARGHSYKACELALAQLASKRFPLELVTTHRFGLKDVDLAIRSVGNEGVPDVIHASLMPWS